MAVINTNVASLNTQRLLSSSQADLNTSIQRLSSGLRVNSAKDDAAGLSIATKMDSQIRGMNVSVRNANDGISMAQTAEGAMTTISDTLQRMRELAVQSSNGSNGTDERANLDAEYQELGKEITRIASNTSFNGIQLLDGSAGASGTVTFHVGSGNGSGNVDEIDVKFTDVKGNANITGTTGGDLKSATNATKAMDSIDKALADVNTARSGLGASQNRLGYAITNLQTSVENTSSAKSRIMDTDFAAETAKMTRGQILQQAGTAMLAQANQLPNGVLALLRG